MANSSVVQGNFLGGEWSDTAQGNWSDPKYKISMNLCLNGFPMAPGAWTRRSGTLELGFTRQAQAGRLYAFDFEEAQPYNVEMTAGYFRFWNGTAWATTNDSVAVSSFSTATPAVATLASAVTWTTGNAVYFTNVSDPWLLNRAFLATVINSTHISLVDEVTGVALNGTQLSATSATINRIQEVTTSYTASLIPSVRLIQSEDQAIVVQGSQQPNILTAVPNGTAASTFSLATVQFLDGPYLDYLTNGAQVTPNALSGIVQLTLSFPTYSATTSYPKGAFVTSSSANYESLVDQNINQTPTSSPLYWQPVNSAAAINNGQGFLPTDVGRLIRLYSEPPLWSSASISYTSGQVVSYNPSGIPGASTYWQCTSNNTSSTANFPGASLANWEVCAPGAALPLSDGVANPALVAAGPAQWTWGRITGLLNFIAGNVAGVSQIGSMTAYGGLSAAFNGLLNQGFATSAGNAGTSGYVGQDYFGTGAGAYKIASATIYPTSDYGFAHVFNPVNNALSVGTLTAYLYASNSLPSSATNGTLLGSAVIGSWYLGAFGNTNVGLGSPVTILSSDTTDSFAFWWITLIAQTTDGATGVTDLCLSQVQFAQAAGSAASANGVTVEILGASLLYQNAILSWKLGAYSYTTGFPTNGTYIDGRLVLGGVISNRFDMCYSNGISGNNINFAPTDQYGTVTNANGVSLTFNLPDANPIFWMKPDQQGIIMGTQAGEILVYAPGSGGLGPLNIDSKRVTKIRCANIEPRQTEHTAVFVQAFQRKIVEYFPDVFSGKFTAPDLTEKWKHLTVSGIAEIAYQQELIPTIWLRINNGNLVGATYKRDTLMTSQGPTFCGAHHHTLGSGRSVQSLVAGPSEEGNLDAISMVTLDAATGYYHVEMLGDLFEEGDPETDAAFCDGAPLNLAYSAGPSSVTISGLWTLNGYKVDCFLGGVDCGTFGPVSNGSVTVPFAGLFTAALVASFAGTMPCVVGFSFTSQGQLLRVIDPQEAQSRRGPALGNLRRDHQFAVQLVETQGISFGTNLDGSTKLHSAIFKSKGGTPYAANQLFTGVYRDTLSSITDLDSMLCWQISRPWPATVAAIAAKLGSSET
jgi:hypothetical protein